MSEYRNVDTLFEDSLSSPNKAKKIISAYTCTNKTCPIPYTPIEALDFIIVNNFTKQQYTNIRNGSKNRNSDIYPSYENVLIEKKL
jgi:hypothetical protein